MNLNLLLDENIPFALIPRLTHLGHDVAHLKLIGKTGIRNGEVYRLAEAEGRWILTRDADFQNLSKFHSYSVPGILLLKLTDTRVPAITSRTLSIIESHAEFFQSKHLIVAEDTETRVYP